VIPVAGTAGRSREITMMNELGSVFHELEMHQRQEMARERAHREAYGVTADRERRWLLRRITRHSS
jgi:hypothetical protein